MSKTTGGRGVGRKRRTFKEKLGILEYMKKNEHVSRSDICRMFNIRRSTLSDLVKKKTFKY